MIEPAACKRTGGETKKMADKQLTGRKSDRSSDSLKDTLEYSVDITDTEKINHTFQEEQKMLEMVKTGNVEEALEYVKGDPDLGSVDLTDYYQKKNEEYLSVIIVALLCRAVMETGVAPEESFQVSDIFLKKIGSAPDVESIIAIRKEAVVEYTRLVRTHKELGKGGMYVEQCKQYIARNIFRKIRVSDIAQYLNLNPIYMERVFKRSEGITIGTYIQRAKVARAQNLLRYSDRSLAEISDYLCFSSQSYFGQIFKKVTGMTPREYQLENKVSEK